MDMTLNDRAVHRPRTTLGIGMSPKLWRETLECMARIPGGVGVGVCFTRNTDAFTPYDLGTGLTAWYKVAAGTAEIPTPAFQPLSNGDAWTKGTGWTVANGVATCDGTQAAASNVYQVIGAPTGGGDLFTITYTIDSITLGAGDRGVRVYTGSTAQTERKTPGTYTETTACTSNPNIGISAIAAGTQCVISRFTIDKHTTPYLTLRASSLVNGTFDVDANWTKSTPAWTISDGAARCDGTQTGNTSIYQAAGAVGDTYKVQIVVSAVSGTGIRVRIGTDDPGTTITTPGTYTFTRAAVGNGYLYITAGAYVTAVVDSITYDPQHVSQLSDLSGWGRHLMQTTGSKQPVYSETGGPGGKPSIVFNGTSHTMKTSAFTWNRPNLFLGVLKWISAGISGYIFDGNVGNAHVLLVNGSNNMGLYQGSYLYFGNPAGVPASGTTYVYETLANGDNSRVALNGGTRKEGSAGTLSQAGGFTLGSASAGSSLWTNIVVSEIVLMNRDFVGSERAQTIGLLNANWGVY